MALTPGTRLGPYEILSALAAGGMGEVYRARDTRLHRSVAIKVLPEALQGDPDFRQRFDREARAIAALNHPHICTLYDVGEQRGTLYLVMELLGGETLATRLERGAVPLKDALGIAVAVASGLDVAHRAGIVHRDLKPGNIMLTQSGAKLLDFGLAKAAPVSAASTGSSMLATTAGSLTAQGTILGTFGYMAPEQLEGHEADPRTDIFAFGAVLYEMLTGKKPFQGQSRASLIGAVMHATPPPIAAVQPLVPIALERLITVCLAKDPDDRWQSVADVKRELQWMAEGGAQTATAAPVIARGRSREYLGWGVAALVALVAAIGVPMLERRAASPAAVVRFTVSPPSGAVRPTQSGFAMAPDGRTLAFTATGADGVRRIFLRRLDAAEARPVVGSDRAQSPFWSPNSESLGFVKDGGVYRVDLDGSDPRRLGDVPGDTFGGGTWSSRGVIVFASSAGLLRIADTGGTSTPVTSLDPRVDEVSHSGPWFLPDGRRLLFLELGLGQTRGTVWATAIDDPTRTLIVESYGAAAYADGWLFSTTSPPRGLVAQPFDPEGLALSGTPQPVRDLLTNATTNGPPGFAVASSGVLVVDRPPPILHRLVWVDRTGQQVDTVGPVATINVFAVAPDERRVVAQVMDSSSQKRDLWLFDQGRDHGTRLTYDGAIKLKPLWARDARHIYFTERVASGLKLRTLAIGAAEPTDFENPGSFVQFLDVTRDGRYVVLKSSPTKAAIWLQRVGNASERRALVQGPFDAVQARVSSDGRWLAYTLALPSGPEVFVQPFDRRGDRIQVSVKGGSGPLWRDDGRELYYEAAEGLMVVPTTGHADTLETGAPQQLFSLRTQGLVSTQPHNVEVAAGGKKFLVNTIIGDSDNVPLEVTLNWTTALKR